MNRARHRAGRERTRSAASEVGASLISRARALQAQCARRALFNEKK